MDKENLINRFFSETRNHEIETAFYHQFDRMVWKYIVQLSIPESEREDFHSEMWEKLLRMPPTAYRNQNKSFGAWLYTVVKNTYLHKVRDAHGFSVDLIPGYHDRADIPSDIYRKERKYKALLESIEKLDPIHKVVIQKFFLEKKSQAEVCAELNIRLCTLNKRRSVALKKLRAWLSPIVCE